MAADEEHFCFIQQPDDQNVEDKGNAELQRTRGKLRQEERLEGIAAVDKGERPALIENRAEDNRGQERQTDCQRIGLPCEHRTEKTCAQTIENRRDAEQRIVAVAREQAADQVRREAHERAGDGTEEHAGEEDGHRFQREARRHVGHRDDQPRQHHADGGENGGNNQRSDIFETARMRARDGCRLIFRHKNSLRIEMMGGG